MATGGTAGTAGAATGGAAGSAGAATGGTGGAAGDGTGGSTGGTAGSANDGGAGSPGDGGAGSPNDGGAGSPGDAGGEAGPCPGEGTACTTGLQGVCAAGLARCRDGGFRCEPTAATAEVCDGIDNDCDGLPDEINDVPGLGQACAIPGQVGPCAAGLTACLAGQPGCVQTSFPSMEYCNGADDDCNGVVDDAAAVSGSACQSAAGCEGVTACNGGVPSCTAPAGRMAPCGTGLCPAPAGTPDFTLALHVVVGPRPVQALGGAAVRAQAYDGTTVEGITDPGGDVSLSLAGSRAPWSVTVAKAGHSAVSVLGLDDATPLGDIMLDPQSSPGVPTGTVTGTLSGLPAGHTATIDAFDFQTVEGATTSYSSTYHVVDAALPVQLWAMALDPSGWPSNFVLGGVHARTGTITEALAFPSPATAPRDAVIDVTFGGGVLSGAYTIGFNPMVYGFSAARPYAWALMGKARGTALAGLHRVEVRSYDAPVEDPIALINVVFQNRYWVNVVAHEPAVSKTLPLGAVTCSGSAGSTLANYQAGFEAQGYDALVIHVGETTTQIPRWRVFVPVVGGAAGMPALPTLPTGITLSSIGFTPGAATTALPMLLRMHRGAPWSAPAANGPIPEYAHTVSDQYWNITATGR